MKTIKIRGRNAGVRSYILGSVELLEALKSEDIRLPLSVEIGDDCVISSGVKIGECIRIKSGVGVGYDSIIGSFSSLGENVAIGESCYVGSHVTIGEESVVSNGSAIEDYAQIGEFSQIGRHCHISSGARIQKGCIGHDTTVGDNVYLGEDCSIGENSFIAPYVRLPYDTNLRPKSDVSTSFNINIRGLNVSFWGTFHISIDGERYDLFDDRVGNKIIDALRASDLSEKEAMRVLRELRGFVKFLQEIKK